MEIDIIITPEGEGEDRIYSISCIQIPNVVTQGKTLDEAKMRLKEALELYFEEMPKEKEKVIEIVEEKRNVPMISRMFL